MGGDISLNKELRNKAIFNVRDINNFTKWLVEYILKSIFTSSMRDYYHISTKFGIEKSYIIPYKILHSILLLKEY